ncbi:hypothetical protein HII17_17080 [Thalassotalea sp. M1531]|uniref:Lipoprotein n=1 Tax=Thalassotalea algicola TaxID=2716224 RepID=A0A7Y0LFI9_9GAMM|nr:hypothetical protein [Thalassotalea algicola]NMP33269.1 hypothetical protein [Thalassotalea algicola]
MMTFKTLFSLILITLISACSSTQEYSYQDYPIEKKSLTNDTELLVNLLKRPTTADQIMMAQFAATQSQYFNLPQVSYVRIRGNKQSNSIESDNSQPQHHLDILYSNIEANLAQVSAPY